MLVVISGGIRIVFAIWLERYSSARKMGMVFTKWLERYASVISPVDEARKLPQVESKKKKKETMLKHTTSECRAR